MNQILNLFRSWNWTISRRIAVGNAVVIICGAIGGTLLTRHLAGITQDIWLILLFALVGITASVVINTLIIRQALKPLKTLRRTLEVQSQERVVLEARLLADPDPDIRQLAQGLKIYLGQLDRRAQQLRALSERALHSQEDERRRIARGLHDDTGQALSMLIVHLEQTETLLAECPGPQAQSAVVQLAELRRLAVQSLGELRTIIFGLRPSILDDLGLVPAIRWYARTVFTTTETHFSIESDVLPPHLPDTVLITFYRIAQEALGNIVRHAQAHHVQIHLRSGDGQIVMEISDDGIGFNPAQAATEAVASRRLGLLGIRERAELLGGDAQVNSRPNHGTIIIITIPLDSDGEPS